MNHPLIKNPLAHWLFWTFCFVAAFGFGERAQAADKKLKLAFVTNNASDFWTIARAGTKKASEELKNVTVEFKIPLVGGKIESIVGRQVIEQIAAIQRFTTAWITQNG